MDKNIAGVNSKEQAVRWANTHQNEAEQIALDIAKVSNIVPQELSPSSSDNLLTKENLRSSFDKHAKQITRSSRYCW
ncbi:MAG: hypothetical protein LN588_00825 [Rickettsia endosymbiont of Bryobia graminum]|nr:hypothetical protein [Rickettsia endosymbiont of Bryobia graminum]